MRLLNRLNQYQRLWQPSPESRKPSPSANWPNAVFAAKPCSYAVTPGTGGGMAGVAGESGRGKRGQLRFLVTPESLRMR